MKEKIAPLKEGEMPDKAHLLLYTSLTGDEAIAMPPGANIGFLVRTVKGDDPMHRLVLMEVTREKLRFKCMCAQDCTLEYVFVRTVRGGHPRNRWRSTKE
jgi:hypothetical protein